ncbi:MAG: hypothetical protein JW939_05045 [Candidatus Thermoplasmatota archaeon]|nr:hypothetical protein [Candidatus Thermoplasmatota archaeon]
MKREEMDDLKKEVEELKSKLETLERDFRLMGDPDVTPDNPNDLIEFKGDFFRMINTLRALYPEREDDKAEIARISKGIEEGRVKVDMTDLFFRFFVRQEIQNARMKLLFLSQRYEVDPELFDQLDDLSLLIEDPRYSVQQVIIGWKKFERDVASEIRRLQEKGHQE